MGRIVPRSARRRKISQIGIRAMKAIGSGRGNPDVHLPLRGNLVVCSGSGRVFAVSNHASFSICLRSLSGAWAGCAVCCLCDSYSPPCSPRKSNAPLSPSSPFATLSSPRLPASGDGVPRGPAPDGGFRLRGGTHCGSESPAGSAVCARPPDRRAPDSAPGSAA